MRIGSLPVKWLPRQNRTRARYVKVIYRIHSTTRQYRSFCLHDRSFLRPHSRLPASTVLHMLHHLIKYNVCIARSSTALTACTCTTSFSSQTRHTKIMYARSSTTLYLPEKSIPPAHTHTNVSSTCIPAHAHPRYVHMHTHKRIPTLRPHTCTRTHAYQRFIHMHAHTSIPTLRPHAYIRMQVCQRLVRMRNMFYRCNERYQATTAASLPDDSKVLFYLQFLQDRLVFNTAT